MVRRTSGNGKGRISSTLPRTGYRVAVALALMLSLIVNSSIMAQRASTTGNKRKPSTTSTSQSQKKAPAATNQAVTGSPEAVIPPPTSPTKEYVYIGGRLIATEEPGTLESPSALAATASASTQVSLTWADNSSNETGFKIESKDSPAAAFTQVAVVSSGTTSYNHTTSSTPSNYTYRVRAYRDSSGTTIHSNYSNEASPLPPAAPSGLIVTAVYSSRIDLRWNDNSNNELEFRLERKVGVSGSYSQIATLAANSQIYSDTTASPPTNYYYRVRAYNFSGNSPYSNEATATTCSSPVAGTCTQVSTLSGDGTLGYLEGPGNIAKWITPIAAVAAKDPVSGFNALFVADVNTHRIRMVYLEGPNYSQSVLIAGSGIQGYWEGDGNALQARYSIPIGITAITDANKVVTALLIVDRGNGVIRKLLPPLPGSTTWRSSLLSGSPGGVGYSDGSPANTLFNQPRGITASSDGFIYVTDFSNGIRKLDQQGNSSTLLRLDSQVYVEAVTASHLTGRLYYTEFNQNNSTSIIWLLTNVGTTTRIAGASRGYADGIGAAALFDAPFDLVWANTAGGEVLYVADGGNRRIRKLKLANNEVSTYAGSGTAGYNDGNCATAQFYTPNGVAVSPAGDVTVVDSANRRIRRIQEGTCPPPPSSPPPPNAPSGLTVTLAANNQIYLYWTDNSDNETGFRLERKVGAEGSYTLLNELFFDTSSFADYNVSTPNTYYYRVKAYNSTGESAYSNEISVALLGPPPPATPGNLTATAISHTQINLSWSDNSNDETSFKLERKTEASGAYIQIAIVSANSTSYSDMGLTPLTTYYYRIRASNANGDSSYSSEVNARTLAPPADAPPVAPTSLWTRAVSSTRIDLNWIDENQYETGFKIERKVGANGTYSQVATVGANTTSYSDTGLSPLTRYYYRVRAYNSYGESGYCNESSSLTFGNAIYAPECTQVSTLSGNYWGYAEGNGSAALWAFPSSGVVGRDPVSGYNALFVTDTWNHRIRMVYLEGPNAGQSVLIAGSGIQGYWEGDGNALQARYNYPMGITALISGTGVVRELFIADSTNSVIRRLLPPWLGISTWRSELLSGAPGGWGQVDGSATNSRYGSPRGVAMGANGYVYVADGNRIRRVDWFGNSSTLIDLINAGVGSAVGITAAGSLYITTVGNEVWQVTYTGVATKLAGSNTAGFADGAGSGALFNFPHHLAWAKTGEGPVLYITDINNSRIRKLNLLTNAVTTYAGSGAQWNGDGACNTANFNQPFGVAVSPTGEVYVMDSSNNRIRRIQAVPNPTPSLESISPTSIATGSNSFTLTLNGSNFITGSVVRVNGNDRATTFVSATQLTTQVMNTDVASEGTLMITVFNPGPGGGVSNPAPLTVGAPNSTPLLSSISPTTVLAGSAGFTLTVNGFNFTNGLVVRVNGSNRATTFLNGIQLSAQVLSSDIASAGPVAITVFNPATGWESNPATLIVTYSGSSGAICMQVSTLSGTGTYGYNEGSSNVAQWAYPFSGVVAKDPVSGHKALFVADNGNHRIRMVYLEGPNTGQSVLIAGSGVQGYWEDNYNAVYARFNNPIGITAISNNNGVVTALLVADTGNHVIRKLLPPTTGTAWKSIFFSGTPGVSGVGGGTSTNSVYSSPLAIVMGLDGFIYVADTSFVRRLDDRGNSLGLYAGPVRGITVSRASGLLYLTTVGDGLWPLNNTGIWQLNTNGTATRIAGSSVGYADGSGAAALFNYPYHLAWASTTGGEVLYIADFQNNRVRKLDLGNNMVSTYAGSATAGYLDGSCGAAQFNGLHGVAVDPNGEVYVIDSWNNRIRKISPVPPPAVPGGLTATATSSSQINLSWTDNSTDETGFKIERKTGATGSYSQIISLGANVTSYSDTGLTPSTSYYYQVRAYNSNGDSTYSNEANATTLAAPPAAPGGLTATAVSTSQINLSWTDNSNNETGFKLERKVGATGSYTEVATLGANVTSYSNTGLSASTSYYYRIRATNATGDSAYSNEANATTFTPPPPAAPGSLVATAVSTSQINLSWTDNSNDESEFKIERKTGAGGSYTQIATAGANTTAYSDTGLSPFTNYYYRVRACNSYGDSGYSNEANATTPTPVPSLTSISPSSVATGSAAFTLMVNGSNFINGSVVRINGSDRATTYVSGTQLSAAIPSSDVASAASLTITVFNPAPGGGLSGSATLTVAAPNPVPTLSSIYPTVAAVGGSSFTLWVYGSNFINGSVVRVNGSDRTTTFYSATQLSATILSTDLTTAGMLTITVFTPAPGGGVSNSTTLTVSPPNPVPSLSSISPTTVAAGSPEFTLTVYGSNFVNGAYVWFNNGGRNTTFISSTELRGSISSSDVAAPGWWPIRVQNPAPGGGYSNPIVLEVTSNSSGGSCSVSTISGVGVYGYMEGEGKIAQWKTPMSAVVAKDPVSGLRALFVADVHDHRVRMVYLEGANVGQSILIAGSGIAGYYEGNGDATQARYNGLNGITALTDTNGVVTALLVTDTWNAVIRKILPPVSGSTTWRTSLFSGSPGVWGDTNGNSSRYGYPSGIVAAADGFIYLTDSDRVRKLDQWGNSSFVYGFGSSSGHYLRGIAASASSGQVYFTDWYNGTWNGSSYVGTTSKIWKVNSSGTATEVAGTSPGFADGVGASAQFNYLYHLVWANTANGEVIYIADTQNHRVRKLTIATSEVTTHAGSGVGGYGDGGCATAKFSNPYGLAVGPNGEIYATEQARIRKIQ